MVNKIEDQIKNVIADVLGLSVDEVNDGLSPTTVTTWDSLKHMNLVAALEEEFEVMFTVEEIGKMMNYSSIVGYINSKNDL
jgi:acyl carrier protein